MLIQVFLCVGGFAPAFIFILATRNNMRSIRALKGAGFPLLGDYFLKLH